MKNIVYLLLSGLLIVAGCKGSQVVVDEDHSDDHEEPLDTAIRDSEPPFPYRASYTREFDLLHTTLWVSFDWEKERLNGHASLRLTPYFHPSSKLILDAKGFDIHDITMVNDASRSLSYTYPDSFKLHITLPWTFTRTDTFELMIDYTAKPNEIPSASGFGSETSIARGSDKGLYFINADNSDPKKPRQLWTQGETESSSCWFPTIDAPNERTTQEMFITIEEGYSTVSNGVLKNSKPNGDGTRTDHWVMDLPHAPYLFMMAAGPFAKVEDKWRDIAVDYYVDSAYAPYAKHVFGNTPEMIEFYSAILGVDYPWAKYSQVVVHDFVSGAMENTTATIHYDQLHKTDRELLDVHMEDIIAHELFHHWFGDLVTCESWANIALNESFATYGEYLWNEYKYGRDFADYMAEVDLQNYLSEASYKQAPLIRIHYKHRDDVFDRHSYQKGGRILHMLRKFVGDEAFFASLKLYLERHAFGAVEFHHLRLAFEEVTGQDLNWFFKQWFESPGHPVLTIDYEYLADSDETLVTIWQSRSGDASPYFRLPVCIDVYRSDKVERHDVVIEGRLTEFTFPGQPDLINVDAEKMLVCAKNDYKPAEQFVFQYRNAPLYLDRTEALEECSKNQWAMDSARDVLFDALGDPFWGIRESALKSIENISDQSSYLQKVRQLASKDPKASVRSVALAKLEEHEGAAAKEVFTSALGDSSYSVQAQALTSLHTIDPREAYRLSKPLWTEKNHNIISAVADIVATEGAEGAEAFFMNALPELDWWSQFSVIRDFGKYLSRAPDTVVMTSAEFLTQLATAGNWIANVSILAVLQERIDTFQEELDDNPSAGRKTVLGGNIVRLKAMREEINR